MKNSTTGEDGSRANKLLERDLLHGKNNIVFDILRDAASPVWYVCVGDGLHLNLAKNRV